MTTTIPELNRTIAFEDRPREAGSAELMQRYQQLLGSPRLSWTTHQKLIRQLGQGGQGVVYLTERRGADGFTLPIALKVFSPSPYSTQHDYEQAMHRIAQVAAQVAQIQQDNLLDVHNFVDRDRIRIMTMEWVDGYDLRRLLSNEALERMRQRVLPRRWEYLNRVVVTAGPSQPRVKPGVAMAIVRECLAALAALHRVGIVHGDVKPANIMLKCTGNSKIIDIGSAFEYHDPPAQRSCTPRYAAPEVLEGAASTPTSDLASLGYVLIEMLSGRPIFPDAQKRAELLHAKRMLPHQLHDFLPEEVTCNELLTGFCRGLIAADPQRRFPSAEAADLVQDGAAAFQRQLVLMNLAAEYDNEIRLWLSELGDLKS
ncbi:MAG: serine/threonine-protein kinase [Pirellulales bacterium]